MARRPAPGTRDLILDNAGRLFRRHGVRAVGMQQIIDECGCGKNRLYREFPSKDDLVVAYLERNQQRWDALMDEAIRPYEQDGDAAGQLVALVRTAVDQATVRDFRGCPFRNVGAQFPERDHPAHRAAVRHERRLRARLQDLAERAGAAAPAQLADRIMLVIDGVYVNGAMLGARGAATAAVELTEDLIRSSVRT